MTTEATPRKGRVMTEATPQDYWIAENALFIERNANADPDYIQASCLSGAQILVYIKGVIGYDAGHNYQRWTLQASPTVFGSHTEKYVYAAIPRPELTSKRTAIVVFPSERIDVYGKNAAEEQIGSIGYYYIFLQGILTSSGDNGSINREWKQHIVTGYLSSDEAINAGPTESQWFKYSSVDDYVTFLKNLTMKAGTVFAQLFARALTIVSGGSISFEGKEGSITGVATDETPLTSNTDIVTPEYLDNHALSKQHDDRTDHDLAMKNLTVNGTADVFGNTLLRGDLTVGTAEHPQKAHVLGDLEVGVFNKGVQGAKVDFYGNAEFESIVGRSFLEVPELRYNRTTITVGNKWQTEGAGIIEKVWTIQDIPILFNSSTEGIARLKLEDGEVGAIAVDDKCQGVFHIKGVKNDPTTTDTRDGNFHFAGFKTIYFVVKGIYNAITLPDEVKALMEEGETIGEQQYFRYELRAATCASLPAENRNHWTDATHPQPTMHFAAYANATNSDRQASRLTTTTYQLHLAGMIDWTYTEQNMRLIIGWLTGFSFLQRVWDKDKGEFVQVTKELNGEGIATGNIYMWGSIDQFDRVPQLVAQQLYFRATQTSQAPDGIVVNADTHLSYDLNGWQREPITPSATDRFVWQQWLYTYSDGTYQVSEVAFHAADPTALSVVLSQNIVSVAISDWYDPSAPDDISFTLTARMLAGENPLPITQATATYGKTERSRNSDNAVEMNYTATIAPDGMSVEYNVTLNGFVGVAVNGATPEDAFITFALTSDFGTATAVATIAQNREGEDGQDGTDGVSAVDISVNPRSVSLKKATIDQPFSIDVFVAQAGKYLAPMTDYVVSRPTTPSNLVIDQFGSRTDGHFFIEFHVPANNVANGNIAFSVTDKQTKTAYPITVPITMVQDGEPGDDGADGNGIASQTTYFVSTDKPNVKHYDDVSGWSETFPQSDSQKPYIWKCIYTVYTKSEAEYSVPELIATYSGGTNPNLIDNATFVDDNHMQAWFAKSQYVPQTGQVAPTDKGYIDSNNLCNRRHSFFESCEATALVVQYKEILAQIIYSKSKGIDKLKPSQWYTFSFFAKKKNNTIIVEETSNEYGFGAKDLYLIEGREYKVTIVGNVDQTALDEGKYLRTYIYNNDWSEQAHATIQSTGLSSATMTFTPKTTGVYSLRSYLYDNSEPRNGQAYVKLYQVEDYHDLSTFLYPKSVDVEIPMIIDGVVQKTTPSDLSHGWKLTGQWARHCVTFKTPSKLGADESQILLFRLLPSISDEAPRSVWLSMPKLEEGMFATGFVDSYDDVKGDRGYTGVTVRRSEWQEDVDYRNDSAEAPVSVAPDGNRYLDEVSITDLASGKATYFLARPSHNGVTSSAANKPTANGNDYWEPINDLRPLRTSFADIMTAFINYLQVAQIQIVDDNNVPYGAFGGGADVDYPLWFGGKTPNEAVVKFGKNGNAWLGKNFSVVNEDVNVTGNLHVNSLFLKHGDLIMNGGKKYLNLDNHTGNYFVLPDSENVYLPEPENYEGMQITVFLGQSLSGKYSALSSERGIYFPYYMMAAHTGAFVTNSSAAKCIKSFDGLTSVTLVAAKAYSVLDTLYWVVTAQKGIIGLSDGTTPENAYTNEVTMALLPDGRLINYEP